MEVNGVFNSPLVVVTIPCNLTLYNVYLDVIENKWYTNVIN